MTEERQRIVTAEAIGYRVTTDNGYRDFPYTLNEPNGSYVIYATAEKAWNEVPHFPTDLTACSALIDFLEKRGYACVMVAQHGKRCCTFTTNGRADCKAVADTFPAAICKSFLTVLGLWES